MNGHCATVTTLLEVLDIVICNVYKGQSALSTELTEECQCHYRFYYLNLLFFSLPEPKAHKVSLKYTSGPSSVRRRPHFQTWISLKPVGQSWSNFMCSIDFGPVQSSHFGVTCPWMTKILYFRTWISLRPVDQSWSKFMCSITGGRGRLHKVLKQIGSKLWCAWQQNAPTDL